MKNIISHEEHNDIKNNFPIIDIIENEDEVTSIKSLDTNASSYLDAEGHLNSRVYNKIYNDAKTLQGAPGHNRTTINTWNNANINPPSKRTLEVVVPSNTNMDEMNEIVNNVSSDINGDYLPGDAKYVYIEVVTG